MRVCDWCHGTKQIQHIDIIQVSSKTPANKTTDLCGPCLVALVSAVNAKKRERMLLRPDSILKEV